MSNRRVQDKVALATGAGSGIGRATASLFASKGATALVADIDEHAVQAVVAEIIAAGGKAEPLSLDVTDEEGWRVTMERIAARHRLDVVVNNAGISFAKSVADMSLQEWLRVLAINLLGTKHGILALRAGGGGSIVNVASVSGIKPFAGAAAYGASKAAVRLFSNIAAIECQDARNGVRINVVTPGGVKTPMWQGVDFFRALVTEHGGSEEAFAAVAGALPSQQFFSAEEVARTILYLASDESAHLSGIEVIMDRGHTG